MSDVTRILSAIEEGDPHAAGLCESAQPMRWFAGRSVAQGPGTAAGLRD
jgi:hypothetical protein